MYDEFNTEGYPLAFLITFRCYGTWLPGDARGTITRHHNTYGDALLPPDREWRGRNEKRLKTDAVRLCAERRKIVERAIRETCLVRGWSLHAVNVRTNHVHAVVGAGNTACRKVLSVLKANATRELRESGLWKEDSSPWAGKGSSRYLWNQKAVWNAVEYVIEKQGNELG